MGKENRRVFVNTSSGLYLLSVLINLSFIGISSVDGGIFTALSEIITFGHSAYKKFCKNEPPQEAFMSTPELISHHGYPVEEHKVVTEDGYVLTVFRIPYGKAQRIGAPKQEPVVIYHGILQSCGN